MKEKEIDVLFLIDVGDNWYEKIVVNIIVIKDGVVIEICLR